MVSVSQNSNCSSLAQPDFSLLTDADLGPKTKREFAFWYVGIGWPVFPCRSDEKNPACDHGFYDATTDLSQIDAWWPKGQEEAEAYNIAIYPEACGLCVVDEDSYKEGSHSLDLPLTFTVGTPRGGSHSYFAGSLRGSGDKLGKAIDTKGVGGYVLVPGSVYKGKPYIVKNDCPIAPLPDEIAERLRAPERPDVSEPLRELTAAEIERGRKAARAYINSRLQAEDFAIQGDHGDDRTIQLFFQLVRDYGLPEDDAVALVMEPDGWNDHCEPPWSEDELRGKAASATKSGQNPIGSKIPTLASEAFKNLPAVVPAIESDPARTYPRPLSGSELAEAQFPRAEWLVENLLLKGVVNRLDGDGGIGKTALALHVGVAVAAGKPLFGHETKQQPVLFVLGEDGAGEIKHRLSEICGHFDVSLAGLPVGVWCLPGYDITLASVTDKGEIELLPFCKHLVAELERMHQTFGSQNVLVILDSLTDVSSYSEKERHAVNAFLKKVCGGICEHHNATIYVLGHPSKASMEDRSYYSGSTHNRNAVRLAQVLRRPDGDTKSNKRIFEVAKSNYGSLEEIELFSFGNIFHEASSAEAIEVRDKKQEAILATTQKLIGQGIRIVRSNGNGQKPKDVAQEVLKDSGLKVTAREVTDALNKGEREGILCYVAGSKNSPAGFERVTQC